MTDEEKIDTISELARVMIAMHSKTGKLEINCEIWFDYAEDYRFVHYITAKGVCRGSGNGVYQDYYTYKDWFIITIYDYLIDKYGIEYTKAIDFIGEGKEEKTQIMKIKKLVKFLIDVYGKNKKLEINDNITWDQESFSRFVRYINVSGISSPSFPYYEEFNKYEQLALELLDGIYNYLIDKYEATEFIGENKVHKMTDEEKIDAIQPLAKYIVSLHGKHGILEIESSIEYEGTWGNKDSSHIHYINSHGMKTELSGFKEFGFFKKAILIATYDFLTDIYEEDALDDRNICEFIGERYIPYQDIVNLVKALGHRAISTHYYDNYHQVPDFDTLLDYFYELWQFVNNEAFITHWINEESSRLATDGWRADIDNQFYDLDLMIIAYVRHEIGNADDLYGLETDELKAKVTNLLKRNDFCKWLLKEKFGNSTAEDMYDKYYGITDKDPFYDNDFNICDYLNEEQMEDEYLDSSSISWYDMAEILADNIDNDGTLQKMIWNNDESTCVILVEDIGITRELGILPDFQRSYLTKKVEELGKDTEKLWNLMKINFITKNNIPVNREVANDFDFLDLLDGYTHGFIA